jgi:trimeric autotransporter adhesin
VPSRRFLNVAVCLGMMATVPWTSFCQQPRAIETPIDGPAALAIDREGHLFVASLHENNVRRVDLKTGTIETVAGSGRGCCYKENAKATDVSLDTIWAIAVNSAGDLFISEGERIRKVDVRTGLISTVAGTGESGNTAEGLLATSTSFVMIWGLAVDTSDDLFVADKAQEKIFKIETASGPAGRVYRVAGSGRYGFEGDGGRALDASFSSVGSIVLDKNQNLIIADEDNCRIRRVNHDTGIIDTIVVTERLAACLEQAKNPLSLMPSPTALAINLEGILVFAETARNVVMRASTESPSPSIVAGNGDRDFSGDDGPASKAALSGPSGLAIDSHGDLLIGDIGNNRVRRVDAVTKTIQTVAGNGLPHIIHSVE